MHSYNDPRGYNIHFNSDLSGDAFINKSGPTPTSPAEWQVELPADVLVQFQKFLTTNGYTKAWNAIDLLNTLTEVVTEYVSKRPDDSFAAMIEARGSVETMLTDIECRIQRNLDRARTDPQAKPT